MPQVARLFGRTYGAFGLVALVLAACTSGESVVAGSNDATSPGQPDAIAATDGSGSNDSSSTADGTANALDSSSSDDGAIAESGVAHSDGSSDGAGGTDGGTTGDATSGHDGSTTSDATTSDAEEDAYESSDGSADAAPKSDGGGADTSPSVDSGPCDLITQTGCPTGDECTLNTSNEPACYAAGSATTGEECAGYVNSCVKGDICVTDSEDGGGTTACNQYCGANSDCTQAPYSSGNGPCCTGGLSGSDAGLCTVPCNPVTAVGSTGCATGLGCAYFVGLTGIDGGSIDEATSCASMGTGKDNAVCSYVQDCATGYTCVILSGTTGKCRQVCRAGDDGDCTGSGDVCTPFVGETLYNICCPGSGTC